MTQRSNKQKQTTNNKKFRSPFRGVWTLFSYLVLLLFITGCFMLGIGAGYFASLVKDEPIRSYAEMKQDIYDYEKTSKIYFAGEEYYGDIRSDIHRERIELSKIPDVVKHAVIATEDERFYEHNGIVPKAIGRAMIQEVTGSDIRTGGSTLTQQLIKNQMLTNEVSFERKAKEILLALRVDRNFEKDEILEAYLNVIPYGREPSGKNIAGIKTAANGIFGVEPEKLSLPQAAYLAGLPQSPSAYTPYTQSGDFKDEKQLESGVRRMKYVLKRMYEADYISKKEYDDAVKYDIIADFQDKSVVKEERAPSFSDEVERRASKIIYEMLIQKDDLNVNEVKKDEELHNKYKELANDAMRQNGYRIYTTIDKDIFYAMEKATKDHQYYGPDKPQKLIDHDGKEITVDEPVQVGAYMMENKTGKIISFVGSRGYSTEEQNNYATERIRPNGSTMKPILVFAPAMEAGIMQPGSVYADYPKSFGGKTLNNYGGGNYGLVSARTALAHSYNIPTVEIYDQLMRESNPAKEYLVDQMEFSHLTETDLEIHSLALGQPTYGVTLEETTNAFQTFGNDGKFIKGFMIEKITTDDGEVIYEHKPEQKELFSPQTTYLTIDMLRDVLSYGTGASVKSYLQHSGVDWFGKTGTSSDYKDALFVGVNPNITVGVWTGYKTPKSLQCSSCGTSYSQRTQRYWADVVNAAASVDKELVMPTKRFNQPEGIVSRSYCAVSGLLPSELCSELGLVRSDLYNSKFVPTKTDDSLIRGGSTVVVDGQSMPAGPNTPSEFVTGKGISFNPEFLKRKGYDKLGDISMLYPRTNREIWEKIGVGSSSGTGSVTDTGKAPAAPSNVQLNGRSLSWGKPGGTGIIGYRVYEVSGGSTTRIGHTTSMNLQVPSESAEYIVRTVDYFGRESENSSIVGNAADTSEEVDSEDEENDDEDHKEENNKDEKDEQKEENKNEKEENEDQQDQDRKKDDDQSKEENNKDE